ncbi:hypothetical protein DFH07DRAFT_752391, partial [Mycena maculata]
QLANGWEGRIIHTKCYFDFLDSGMVVLTIFTLNFGHPRLLLRPRCSQSRKCWRWKARKAWCHVRGCGLSLMVALVVAGCGPYLNHALSGV